MKTVKKNMSAFKRYQSKVFWDQMASRDLEDDRSVRRNDPPFSFNENVPEKKKEREEKEEEEEDDSTKSENDTIDDANITAIHVCKSDENTKQNACRISLIRDESITRHRYVK